MINGLAIFSGADSLPRIPSLMLFQNSHYCRREDVAKTRLEYCDYNNATREKSARKVEGHVSALGLCLKVGKIEVFLGIRAKGLMSRAARGDSSKKEGIH